MGAASDSRSDVPRIRPDVDLTKLGLSVEEGFIASRIDGHTTVRDIALMVGKSEPETKKVLDRLAKVGVVYYGDDLPKSVGTSVKEDGRIEYGDFIFPLPLMQEAVELKEHEKKRIIYFHSHLDEWTHYEFLQAGRTDDPKDIKRAYFSRSKEWHPDRFRRGELGSFRRMIDDIFKQVQNAYGVLSDPKRRDAYDDEIVFMASDEDMAELLKLQKKKDREKRREAEKIARRKKRNPVAKRLDRAKEMYQEALEAKENGQHLAALRVAQMALAFDERPEYEALVAELKVLAGDFLVGPHLKRGMARERMTQWREAIASFQEAVRIAPENGQAQLRLAFNLLMARRDPQIANPHAQKAVQLLPDDPEAHFVLGLCYERGGMQKAAVRELNRAVELKPNYKEAKKRLRELKWGF